MKMYGVGVDVDQGEIYISQEAGGGEPDQIIVLSVEQVGLVCRWLKDAAQLATKNAEKDVPN